MRVPRGSRALGEHRAEVLTLSSEVEGGPRDQVAVSWGDMWRHPDALPRLTDRPGLWWAVCFSLGVQTDAPRVWGLSFPDTHFDTCTDWSKDPDPPPHPITSKGFCCSPVPRTPAPRKDPPWITLVQAEPKKKLAPLPPGSPGPPRRADTGGQEEGGAQQSPATAGPPEPKHYNPFEEEEEEEEPPAVAPSPAAVSAVSPPEPTSKSLHPWYGITPTSSPKTKKRPAPPVPSASPLGELGSWGSGPVVSGAGWSTGGPPAWPGAFGGPQLAGE